jgi:hypothetical protein
VWRRNPLRASAVITIILAGAFMLNVGLSSVLLL